MNEQQQAQKQAPSKEEVVRFLSDQIEVKELQARLQKLNTEIAVDRASELEAYAKISHYTSAPKNDEIVEHTVTQDDIDNNPELGQNNVKVGDVIGIPKAAYEGFLQSSKEITERLTGESVPAEEKQPQAQMSVVK